jgi:hypothetical protein
MFTAHTCRDCFVGQGEHGFTAWSYVTRDKVEQVLAHGYFNEIARLLRVGDLIWLGTAQSKVAHLPGQPLTGERRRLLLMVAAVGPAGAPDRVRVRVAQDLGTPEDGDVGRAASEDEGATGNPRPDNWQPHQTAESSRRSMPRSIRRAVK